MGSEHGYDCDCHWCVKRTHSQTYDCRSLASQHLLRVNLFGNKEWTTIQCKKLNWSGRSGFALEKWVEIPIFSWTFLKFGFCIANVLTFEHNIENEATQCCSSSVFFLQRLNRHQMLWEQKHFTEYSIAYVFICLYQTHQTNAFAFRFCATHTTKHMSASEIFLHPTNRTIATFTMRPFALIFFFAKTISVIRSRMRISIFGVIFSQALTITTQFMYVLCVHSDICQMSMLYSYGFYRTF